MNGDKMNMGDKACSSAEMGGGNGDGLALIGSYKVECYRFGELLWEEEISNLVTTAGRNLVLNTFFSGAAYTASIAMGLKGVGSASASDAMTSHAAWNEVGGNVSPAYSGDRKSPTFAGASGGIISSSQETFTMTSSGDVAGCFLVSAGATAKDSTTGTLFSAGNFTNGTRTVQANDLLKVTYTLTTN